MTEKEKKEHYLANFNVTMSNKLVRASQALTLTEKRIITACIAKINSENGSFKEAHLSQFERIKLTALDYADLYKVDPKAAYRDLKKAADNLFERQITLSRQHRKGERVYRFRWVGSVVYAEREGFIELGFTPDVYPFLNALTKHYTTYKLRNGCSFRGIYTWRFFELIQTRKDTQTLFITVEELAHSLDIPQSYKWNDIKKRSIEPAIKELKKVLKIDVGYEVIKNGRAITSLKIYWKQENQLEFFIK
jgi:plasmid replication initiation protein